MTLEREEISDKLAAVGYIADRDIATALWLMDFLKRPLLLEGEAGVGKTEVGKALAAVHGAELIRLQCYEGLDQNAALYEWNYQRQLLAIKTREGAGEDADAIEEHIFSEKYLLERPLLAAIRRASPPVLLIDEVDRADEEFEAFLLELLSDFQVSIPELGTVKAVLNSARRADLERHPRIVRRAATEMPLSLCRFPGHRPRGENHPHPFARYRHHAGFSDRAHGGRGAQGGFAQAPGVAETLDWAATLAGLEVHDLRQEPEAVYETMICLLKTHEDRARSHVKLTSASSARWRNAIGGTHGLLRLSGFARTLRDNGFRVGIAETRDALSVLASPAAPATSLKPALRALFCATHSDWERFDEIFDAYWQGRHMRQRQVLSGAPGAAKHARKLAEAHAPSEALGLPDHVERRTDGDEASAADGRGRREGASRAEVLTHDRPRHIVDPEDVAATHALAARLARVMRARSFAESKSAAAGDASTCAAPFTAMSRMAARCSISPGGGEDQAAAACRAARRFRLDEPLHRVFRALPARRRRCFPRGRGLRLPHPPGARFAVAARSRRHARRRQAVADGPRHRRRHAHRRKPRHVQSLARAPRHQFAHRGDDRLRRLRHRRAGHGRGNAPAAPPQQKIIWLNPLLGWRDYSPQARGMQAALPYVDLFAPAHNLESLAALEPYLAKI